MTTTITLDKIDTSYWKTKDPKWMAARKASWPTIEEMLRRLKCSKKSMVPVENYYLTGKTPNWKQYQRWVGRHADDRHLDLFCFIWLHPSRDPAVLRPLRDAYISSNLIVQDDVERGLAFVRSAFILTPCSQDSRERLQNEIVTGCNELLFDVLMGDLRTTQLEINGYYDDWDFKARVVKKTHPKHTVQLPQGSMADLWWVASWICLKKMWPAHEDMVLQYDKALEWWYLGASKEADYFQKNDSLVALLEVHHSLHCIAHYDESHFQSDRKTRFVKKLHAILNEREFFPEFAQMWQDVKSKKIAIENPWKNHDDYRYVKATEPAANEATSSSAVAEKITRADVIRFAKGLKLDTMSQVLAGVEKTSFHGLDMQRLFSGGALDFKDWDHEPDKTQVMIYAPRKGPKSFVVRKTVRFDGNGDHSFLDLDLQAIIDVMESKGFETPEIGIDGERTWKWRINEMNGGRMKGQFRYVRSPFNAEKYFIYSCDWD